MVMLIYIIIVVFILCLILAIPSLKDTISSQEASIAKLNETIAGHKDQTEQLNRYKESAEEASTKVCVLESRCSQLKAELKQSEMIILSLEREPCIIELRKRKREEEIELRKRKIEEKIEEDRHRSEHPNCYQDNWDPSAIK